MKQKEPIKIDAADLSPMDLGDGWKLKFQRNQINNKVRAVVMDNKGEIYATGEVVDESEALISRLGALANSRKRTFNKTLGLTAEATDEEQLKAFEKHMYDRYDGPYPLVA